MAGVFAASAGRGSTGGGFLDGDGNAESGLKGLPLNDYAEGVQQENGARGARAPSRHPWIATGQ